MGGAAGENLTIAPLKSAQADRRKRDWKRSPLAEDRCARIPARHIDKHSLAEPDTFHISAVGAQCLAKIGACLGIAKEGARNFSASGLSQIFDAGDVLHNCRNGATGRGAHFLAGSLIGKVLPHSGH
jgi:hypothetical protein